MLMKSENGPKAAVILITAAFFGTKERCHAFIALDERMRFCVAAENVVDFP